MLSRLGPGGVEFHDEIFHRGYVLPVNSRKEGDEVIYEVLLPAGSSFSPGTHISHDVSITILSGIGELIVGETPYRYVNEGVFFISAGVPHGFTQVIKDTVFEKRAAFVKVSEV